MKTENLNYWIDTDRMRLQVAGEKAFEMFGALFGIHREIVKDPWGWFDNFVITDVATGRQVWSSRFRDESIATAMQRLEEVGAMKYFETVKEASEELEQSGFVKGN